ncbi:uncharacterized protein JCM10292_007442 [Rhodotorula paludigena]|uniref:uncharacterized protein n=1 Tax=Rhodotorula paludigena TaxID=86838 RepID=UPI00317EAD03
MPSRPVDIGTGHEPRITPGRARTQQVPLRQLANIVSTSAWELLRRFATPTGTFVQRCSSSILSASLPANMPEPSASPLAPSHDSDALKPPEPPAATTPSHTGLVNSGASPDSLARSTDSTGPDAVLQRYWQTRAIVLDSKQMHLSLFEIPHLQTFCVRLLLDPHARALFMLRVWQAPDVEREMIFDWVLPDLLVLATDSAANGFVERLYTASSGSLQDKVFEGLRPIFRQIMSSKFGANVARSIIPLMPPDHLRSILLELLPHLLELCQDPTTARAIGHLFNNIAPADFESASDHVLSSFDGLAMDAQGSRMLQVLIQRATRSMLDAIILHVLDSDTSGIPRVHILAMHEYGTYVLQEVLAVASPTDRASMITLIENTLGMLDEQGSNLKQMASREGFCPFRQHNALIPGCTHINLQPLGRPRQFGPPAPLPLASSPPRSRRSSPPPDASSSSATPLNAPPLPKRRKTSDAERHSLSPSLPPLRSPGLCSSSAPGDSSTLGNSSVSLYSPPTRQSPPHQTPPRQQKEPLPTVETRRPPSGRGARYAARVDPPPPPGSLQRQRQKSRRYADRARDERVDLYERGADAVRRFAEAPRWAPLQADDPYANAWDVGGWTQEDPLRSEPPFGNGDVQGLAPPDDEARRTGRVEARGVSHGEKRSRLPRDVRSRNGGWGGTIPDEGRRCDAEGWPEDEWC